MDWGVLPAGRWKVMGPAACGEGLSIAEMQEEATCCSLVPSRCSAAAQLTNSKMLLIAPQVPLTCFQPLLARIWTGQWEHTETQIVSALLDFNLEPFHSINLEIFLQAFCCNIALCFCVLWKSLFFFFNIAKIRRKHWVKMMT